jgi:hypothetical protein
VEQVNADAGDLGQRCLSENILTYCKPGQPPRVVVPVSKRDKVLRLVHEELGHGATSTGSELKKVFYWPRMQISCARAKCAVVDSGESTRLTKCGAAGSSSVLALRD